QSFMITVAALMPAPGPTVDLTCENTGSTAAVSERRLVIPGHLRLGEHGSVELAHRADLPLDPHP
ncbi:hypothetical protein, partial [Streptomyces sp. NPDC048341]|uniref:hypothetical protein n=1 Tax=Streptomyces sp. NPDC048341 TaxID=3154620 RepID=UPI0034204B8E